jgi:metal-dependent HD superfamily phosphatase/phosphodiesterase
MERGRSRIPYETGRRGINTVSSQAIESVTLKSGDGKPVLVEIGMRNAAGVYQVDELLQAKLKGSRLEEYVRIVALNVSEEGDSIVERIEL